MDIKKIVNDQISKISDSGELEKLISENIEKSVKSVIEDQFSGYGFRKAIEEKLKEEVDPILKEISFDGYQDIMIDRLKTILNGMVSTELVDKAGKAYKDIFQPKEEPLKISELFETIRDNWLDEDGDSYGEHFQVEIDDDDNSPFRHIYLKFQKEKKSFSSSFENKVGLSFYKDEPGKVFTLVTEHLSHEKGSKVLLKVRYLEEFENILLHAFVTDRPIIYDIDSVDDINTSLYDEN